MRASLLERSLLDTHIWVSLAAAGLTLFAATALDLPARGAPAGAVFAATLLVYAVDDLVDRRGSRAGMSRASAAIPVAAALLLFVQLWQAPPLAVGLVLAGSIPALLYGIPWRGRRFRDLPGVKPLFVSAALAATAVSAPWAWGIGAVPGRAALILFAAIFLLVLANVCFFDLRDLVVDARHGLRTAPVLLGPRGSRALCAILGAIVLGEALLVSPPGAPGLVAASLTTMLCAWRLTPDSRRLTFALAVDGIPIGLGIWAWAAMGG